MTQVLKKILQYIFELPAGYAGSSEETAVTYELAEKAEAELRRRVFFSPFGPELEDRFVRKSFLDRVARLRINSLLGLFVFCFYVVVDFYLLGPAWQDSAILRLGTAIPVALVIGHLMRTPSLHPLVDIGTSVLIIGFAAMILVIQGWALPENRALYNTGTMIVMVFGTTVIAPEWRYAFMQTIAIFVLLLVERNARGYWGDPHTSLTIVDHFAVGMFCLTGNYLINKQKRISFLNHILLEARNVELSASQEKLLDLSMRDPLTGIANRRGFEQAFYRALLKTEVSEEGPRTIGFAVLDVDDFKKYNDSYGHEAGDQALIQVAGALSDCVRGDDIAARFGGEEFVIFWSGATQENAQAICERILARINSLGIEHRSTDRKILTASIGYSVAKADSDAELDLWYRLADECLYQAKNEGKNTYRGVIRDTVQGKVYRLQN